MFNKSGSKNQDLNVEDDLNENYDELKVTASSKEL